jgi:aminocarboxymuconate-semialdehyde decarboxylase
MGNPESPTTAPDPTTPQEWAAQWTTSAVPKPPVTTVDVHTHVLVPESAAMTKPFFEVSMDTRTLYSSAASRELNQEFFRLSDAKYTDPHTRLADMDALGIDIQLIGLSPGHFFYWADEGLAPRVAMRQNETIAEMAAVRPSRFVGVGTLPWGHPGHAVAEAERMAGYGFPAVYVGAEVNGVDLDDPGFEPIWEALEALGLVLILHPAGFTHAQRMVDYYLINVIGMPLSSTLATTRMILGGVFERHPRLRMLVVHGGGYLSFYPGRTDHAFRHRPEMRGHIDRLPSEYLANLYFDTTVFESGMIEHLVRRFGADHVLVGTDYPFDMGEPDPLALVAGAGLSDRERDLVVGGNARVLFGLAD